ncbi:protein GFS12-like [Phoenix dactylifera]|uniref:Protein GFS12-like n=1 Tax=Phoenix dactylifera TaxID=42345 RepID=A0A8B8JC81_PHODC|nr:protein GFS12-like [Phoenix dactylifera]
MENLESPSCAPSIPSDFNLGCLLEYFESDDSGSIGFQEFLHWRQKASSLGVCSEDLAEDIFSIGCILAELYLNRPLFDPVSLAAYKENGIIPGALQELPPHVALLVEASIQRDWKRRPSAKCFLESHYFPPTVRSAYLFLSPLQLLAKTGHRLQYAAKLASEGAPKAMGRFAADVCALLPTTITTRAFPCFEIYFPFGKRRRCCRLTTGSSSRGRDFPSTTRR